MRFRHAPRGQEHGPLDRAQLSPVLLWCLLENHVRVGAAEAERAHAGDAAPVDRRPRRTAGRHRDRQRRSQSMCGFGVCEVQMRRDLARAAAPAPP